MYEQSRGMSRFAKEADGEGYSSPVNGAFRVAVMGPGVHAGFGKADFFVPYLLSAFLSPA
jgi:hypothetical protein